MRRGSRGRPRTGKLVTSGALILMFAFLVLSSGPGFEITSLAVGIAVGTIFDATVIRALLVAALMKLFGDGNWWTPTWLDRVLLRPGTEVLAADAVIDLRAVLPAQRGDAEAPTTTGPTP